MKLSTASRFTLLSFFLVGLIVLTSSFKKKDSTDFKSFEITIQKNNQEVSLECADGCAWLELDYSHLPATQAINQNGMTKSKKPSDSDDFFILVTKTKEGVSLKSKKGTAWTDLSFSLHQSQKVKFNQFGMVRK